MKMFTVIKCDDYHDINIVFIDKSWKTDELYITDYFPDIDVDNQFLYYYYGLIYKDKRPNDDEIKQYMKKYLDI